MQRKKQDCLIISISCHVYFKWGASKCSDRRGTAQPMTFQTGVSTLNFNYNLIGVATKGWEEKTENNTKTVAVYYSPNTSSVVCNSTYPCTAEGKVKGDITRKVNYPK